MNTAVPEPRQPHVTEINARIILVELRTVYTVRRLWKEEHAADIHN